MTETLDVAGPFMWRCNYMRISLNQDKMKTEKKETREAEWNILHEIAINPYSQK